MSKTRITTNDEIKTLLGISGTSQDALIDRWNDIATEMLCELLSVDEVASHTVTDERVCVFDSEYLEVKEFPVDPDSTITMKDVNFQTLASTPSDWYMDPLHRRHLRGKQSDATPFYFMEDEVLLTYTAGYTIIDTLLVPTNPSDTQKFTVKINGTETEWEMVSGTPSGNQIQIGGTAADTAAAIATALGGTANTTTVTMPLGTAVVSTTITDASYTNATIPEALKSCVAFVVGGGVTAKDKVGGINSYTVGQKTVNFRDENEWSFVERSLKTYGSQYKKVRVHS